MLRGVDLVLPARVLVRVEGANGTGKSTLLRLLARIDAPSEGRVTGRPRTAYVPERFPAALPFTAAGYLVRIGRVHGLRASDAAGRADHWLTRFGAAAHARTPSPNSPRAPARRSPSPRHSSPNPSSWSWTRRGPASTPRRATCWTGP